MSRHSELDITGKMFGTVTALYRDKDFRPNHPNNVVTVWMCQCKCGHKFPIRFSALTHRRVYGCENCQNGLVEKDAYEYPTRHNTGTEDWEEHVAMLYTWTPEAEAWQKEEWAKQDSKRNEERVNAAMEEWQAKREEKLQADTLKCSELEKSLDEQMEAKRAQRLAKYGDIYLIHGEPISQCGLIGYIGQTTDAKQRKEVHLNGNYDGTILLIETIKAKGCVPTYTRLISCSAKHLNEQEREWYTKYKLAGWALFNRLDLTQENLSCDVELQEVA